MRYFEWRKHKVVFLIPLLLLVCVALLIALHEQFAKPVGGEIFTPDFKDGVEIYVDEGYSAVLENLVGQVYRVSPHSLYLVDDKYLKDEILRLCGEIRQYRELDRASDIMLGTPPKFEYLPQICLITDTYSYRIRMINWENYSGEAWQDFPIRQELFGEPVLMISRIDLSLMPENETPYSFTQKHFGPDSINTISAAGWYSTMSQQDMDELLRLVESINVENAEKVEDHG